MKKSIIALIISILFLVCSIFFVVYRNVNKKQEKLLNEMTVDFVETNYEIDLFDEQQNSKINLNAKAEYIGNKEIAEQPEIKLQIACVYLYEDVGQIYTDRIVNDMLLKFNEDKLVGNLVLDLKRDSIDSYSCSYKIVEVNGKYLDNEKK